MADPQRIPGLGFILGPVPEVERLPDILSEIAGGPSLGLKRGALIHVGLHETGEDQTKGRKLQ